MDRTASPLTRLLYCAGLFTLVAGAVFSMGGWVALAFGGSLLGAAGRMVSLLVAAGAVFRIYQVIRYPHALDAFVPGRFAASLRGISHVAMLIGGLAGIAGFFVNAIALWLFDGPGDSGIAFFVIKVYVVMIRPLGWLGCLLFEISRWLGRRRDLRMPQLAAFDRRQDAMVAGALIFLFIGAPFARWLYTNRAGAPERCGQERIACVASIESRISRMVSLPLGSAVSLKSNVDAVWLQGITSRNTSWHAVEGVASSLRHAGYPPERATTNKVSVRVDAQKQGEGVLLEARVVENGGETASLRITFPAGSRLEKDSRGLLHVLAPLPAGSDSMVHGVARDDSGEMQTLDELYRFFRRSIGVESEVRESLQRLTITPQSVKRVDGGSWERTLGPDTPIDPRCGGRVNLQPQEGVRSDAAADLGWHLLAMQIDPGTPNASQTFVHRGDRIVCADDALWIVHAVPLESSISLRRYDREGVLRRFVEGPLPAVHGERVFGHIDPMSIREADGNIWFDRVEVQLTSDPKKPDEVRARESFRMPLPKLSAPRE
jgi:hypothetical protein